MMVDNNFEIQKVPGQQWQLRHLIHPLAISKDPATVISLHLSQTRGP